MVIRLGGRGMWSSIIAVTDCSVTEDIHFSDNQCDGQPTDSVNGSSDPPAGGPGGA